MTQPITEEAIVAAGATAPRVTQADLKANIRSVFYFTAEDGVLGESAIACSMIGEVAESLRLLTICVMVLQNGFTIVGTSACASPANFNVEIGRRVAYDNALQQIWPLMGYHLKQQLQLQDYMPNKENSPAFTAQSQESETVIKTEL